MKYIKGDLFNEIKKENNKVFVMHQVNCQNVMGAGFAKTFYQKYPDIKKAFHAYADTIREPHKRFGNIQYVNLTDNVTGVNSFTQLAFGTHTKQTDEKRLIDNIKSVAAVAKAQNATLYVPAFIGCGLAGGDWSVVFNGIKHLDLTIVEYAK